MIRSEQNKWNHRWLELCLKVASWSKDPSTKVGAFIVDNTNRAVSFGYNGLPAGVHDTDDRLTTRDLKYPLTVHAELNAILSAKQDLTGCTLFCTHPPCVSCMATIVQSGITKVVTIYPDEEFERRWDDTLTNEIAYETNVTIVKIHMMEEDHTSAFD